MRVGRALHHARPRRDAGWEMAAIEVGRADSDMPTRWMRNAFLWRYPLIAIVPKIVFFPVLYLQGHVTGSWFALLLLLMLFAGLFLVALLVIAALALWKRHFKLAAAALLAATVIGTFPWYSLRIGPPIHDAIDEVRFYVVRDRYDAIIKRMSAEERASTVVFFNWGESGFAGYNSFYSIAYDESGEILLSDAERSQAWKDKVYSQDSLLNAEDCKTSAFRLGGHFYSVNIHCP